MLSTVNLGAGYGARSNILRSISLSFSPGAVAAVVGPNGSGKSTLLRCLAGALRPAQGRVLVGERDLQSLGAREAAALIAFVPQDNPAPFAFTVGELAGLGATPGAARDALDVLDLAPLRDRALPGLSGGERQRAALARGMAQETPFLLLDEPTAHLDLRHQVALFHALRARARQKNTAVIVVLHDLNLAARWADQVVVLSEGQVALQGSPENALNADVLSRVYRTPVAVTRGAASGALHVSAEHGRGVEDLTFP